MTPARRRQARERLEAIRADKTRHVEELRARARAEAQRVPMTSLAAIGAVADALPPEAVVVDESISSSGGLRTLVRSDDPRSFFGLRGGGIGWGLPAAIGVQLALPDRPVVALIGDGSAMYTCQALWTAARYRLGVTFVILNNASYRILKQRIHAMKGFAAQADQYIAMDLEDPRVDFVRLAESLGVRAERIEKASRRRAGARPRAGRARSDAPRCGARPGLQARVRSGGGPADEDRVLRLPVGRERGHGPRRPRRRGLRARRARGRAGEPRGRGLAARGAGGRARRASRHAPRGAHGSGAPLRHPRRHAPAHRALEPAGRRQDARGVRAPAAGRGRGARASGPGRRGALPRGGRPRHARRRGGVGGRPRCPRRGPGARLAAAHRRRHRADGARAAAGPRARDGRAPARVPGVRQRGRRGAGHADGGGHPHDARDACPPARP